MAMARAAVSVRIMTRVWVRVRQNKRATARLIVERKGNGDGG